MIYNKYDTDILLLFFRDVFIKIHLALDSTSFFFVIKGALFPYDFPRFPQTFECIKFKVVP